MIWLFTCELVRGLLTIHTIFALPISEVAAPALSWAIAMPAVPPEYFATPLEAFPLPSPTETQSVYDTLCLYTTDCAAILRTVNPTIYIHGTLNNTYM